MTKLVILKTGALGDVLRTTSILPGLARRYPELELHWVTAPGARDLVRLHPLVHTVHLFDPGEREPGVLRAVRTLGTGWERVLSFDDEAAVCALATHLARGERARISGAYLDPDGERRYTPDVAPWFEMGLLSELGKAEADRRKLANTRSHPAIFADMLGLEMGEPELPLTPEAEAFAAEFAGRYDLHGRGALVGLNTGAGGRWTSKRLPVERTAELAGELARRLDGRVTFLVLGGPEEAERNTRLTRAIAEHAAAVDAGTGNPLLHFAALVDRVDLLVTSDSLALHVANARKRRIVAFFAPTPAAEIELYGRGECVASTAPDYASYRKDADTSTLTVARLADAAERVLRG